MCGITAYLGTSPAWGILLHSLSMLQNRGYDSAGIGLWNQPVMKFASTPRMSALGHLSSVDSEGFGQTMGIGHTRWATHGPAVDRNAHPHEDASGRFSIVHNGIIENYEELKTLLPSSITFSSQTDSEVICQVWAHFASELSSLDAFRQMAGILRGTWAIVGMDKETPSTLFCSRHGSPLLIGLNEDRTLAMVVSQGAGFLSEPSIETYISLKEKDIVTVTRPHDKKIAMKEWQMDETYRKFKIDVAWETTPAPFPHWTLKEIMSQGKTVKAAIGNGGRIESETRVHLGGLSSHEPQLLDTTDLILLGCGSSLYAAQSRMLLFKMLGGFRTVQAFDGAEFDTYDLPKGGGTKPLVILISQSGETRDLARCIQVARDAECSLIGVVNVVDSLIAREVDCGVYLNAGREVGVASTKSYISQVVVLTLICLWFAQHRGSDKTMRRQVIRDLSMLSDDVGATLCKVDEEVKGLVDNFLNIESCFILGKGVAFPVSLEGALKMKEITYIHVEGFSGSALKHGPFALLDTRTPCIMLAPSGPHLPKMKNASEEVRSRYAPTLQISDLPPETADIPHLQVCRNESFQEILCLLPIQLLAYHLSVKKGINPDMPKNLAKVVTVE